MRRGPARRGVRRRTRRRTRRRVRRRMRRRMIVGGMVLLAGGAVVYKLTKKDADRIEQHTGESVENLTDEEMQQAMQELNIQSQPLDEQDQTAMASASAPGAEEADDFAEEDEPDYLDEIERLAELRDKGILTDEEFEAKKKQLLDL